MMAAFLIYSTKVAICLLAFYGLFRLLLGNETFHGWNRAILLGTSLLSFILPLITIRIQRTVLPAETGATPIPHVLETRPDTALVEETSSLTQTPSLPTSIDLGTSQGMHLPGWDTILGIIFIAGALYVLMRWIFSLINVIRLIRSGEKKTQTSEYTVIVTDRDILPFSWMRYIILPRRDYTQNLGLILQHEKAHVALKHSYDRIAVDLMSVLQWFNPTIWLIREDLQALHEFEADEAVLRQGADIKEYQYLLVRKAVSGSGYSITNSLAHKNLKKRISMMKTVPSGNGGQWKTLWFLPLVAGFLALGSETVYVSAQTTGAQSPAETTPAVADLPVATADTLFVTYHPEVDDWEILGGAAGFDKRPRYNYMDWHGLALQMEEALLNGPQVRKPATVEIAFTVRAEGTMSQARLYKGARPDLDEAVLQAFNAIPHRRWQSAVKHGTPQDVTVVFPVSIKPWIKATPRRLRDKYRHPLDTLCFEFNKTAFSSSQRPVWGALVDGVFHTGQTIDVLKELKGSASSSWIITDSLTLVQCGLSTEKATIGVTTRDYEKKHGKPREVLARERAEAHPEDPRAIDPASSTWLVHGAEGLETMPLFKERGFEKFERWALDHGASVRAADPKQYGSVTVSFVIDEKGRICSPRIVKGLSAATDQAVLEFLLNCPDWEPARKDGRPVPVSVVCPLAFNLLIR